MLEILVATLKTAVELAILLALLGACLQAQGRESLLRPLVWAAYLAIVVGAGLAYLGTSLLEREVTEAAAALTAATLTLGLVVWMRSSQPGGRAARGNAPTGRASAALVFASALAISALRGESIALNAAKAHALADGPGTGEALAISAIVVALGFAALLGMTLYKVVAGLRPRWIALITNLCLLALLVREATTVVQTLLVRGILPLDDWLFKVVATLVNNVSAFYYALFAAACLLVLRAVWERRGQGAPLEGLNPAERRKLRAAGSRRAFLSASAGTLLALVMAVERVGTVYANRPLSLSPPVPVARDGDVVAIPTASVADGTLHRFSYETADGTGIRFLVIHKGSGIYGVALDACEFCGPAGYRQEGKSVICNRCGAAINIATLGFPGGCNPIPLAHRAEADSLVVPVAALEAAKGVFS